MFKIESITSYATKLDAILNELHGISNLFSSVGAVYCTDYSTDSFTREFAGKRGKKIYYLNKIHWLINQLLFFTAKYDKNRNIIVKSKMVQDAVEIKDVDLFIREFISSKAFHDSFSFIHDKIDINLKHDP